MTLPNISMTVRDGGLGLVPQGGAKVHVKAGPCLGGTNYQLYSYNDLALMLATHGQCKTTEAVGYALGQKAQPVMLMPTAWLPGNSSGLATRVGTGLATVTSGEGPHLQITLTITKTGGRGAGEFTYQVGTGAVSSAILIPADGVYIVPGTFCTVTFTSMSFSATDIYIVATTGGVTKGGVSSSDITHVSSPLDDYEVAIKIILGGALGTATFQYSTDSLSGAQGASRTNWSPVITTPSGGVYAIPGTGLFVTLSVGGGNFVANDVYTFNAAAPYITTTESNAALEALKTLSTDFGFIHLVAQWYLCAGAATAAAAVDTKMTAHEADYKYGWTIVECPTAGDLQVNPSGGALAVNAEADATTAAAFAAFVSNRTAVAAGSGLLASAIDGKYRRRNAAWVASARNAIIPISEHPGWVQRGAIGGCVWLYRDEQQVPALDAARFITLRTIQGLPGYYITRGMMMALSTSDFTQSQRRRVMDESCRVARLAMVPYLNKSVRVDRATGYIDGRDAAQIEAAVTAKLETALNIGLENADASAVSVTVCRTNNILSTNEILVTVAVVPLGYAEAISTTIGFTNPAA